MKFEIGKWKLNPFSSFEFQISNLPRGHLQRPKQDQNNEDEGDRRSGRKAALFCALTRSASELAADEVVVIEAIVGQIDSVINALFLVPSRLVVGAAFRAGGGFRGDIGSADRTDCRGWSMLFHRADLSLPVNTRRPRMSIPKTKTPGHDLTLRNHGNSSITDRK